VVGGFSGVSGQAGYGLRTFTTSAGVVMNTDKKPRQNDKRKTSKLDDALEQTFPASDPVSTTTTADIDRRKEKYKKSPQ
jgi:hypothetical protein